MEERVIYGQNMRKIINGSVYDTTKAKEIGRWQVVIKESSAEKPFVSDYVLYKTKSKKYFVFANSFRKKISHTLFSFKVEIIPVSITEASELCKEKIGYIEWVQEFDSTDKKNVSAVISKPLVIAIEKEKEKTGKSVSAIINDALVDALLKKSDKGL